MFPYGLKHASSGPKEVSYVQEKASYGPLRSHIVIWTIKRPLMELKRSHYGSKQASYGPKEFPWGPKYVFSGPKEMSYGHVNIQDFLQT